MFSPTVHHGKQGQVLKDQVHRPPVGRDPEHAPAANVDRAAVGFSQSGNHPQQGRLAAAGGAQYREKMATLDTEADCVNSRKISKGLGHILNRQIDGHDRPSNEALWFRSLPIEPP